MTNKSDTCAYKRSCKGICSSPTSCIKEGMSEEAYWKEIQEAIMLKGYFDRVKDMLSRNINPDLIKKYIGLAK